MHLENVVETLGLSWFFKVLFTPKQFYEIEIKLKNASVLLNITRGGVFWSFLFVWVLVFLSL